MQRAEPSHESRATPGQVSGPRLGATRDPLAFVEPVPSPWLQRIAFHVNYLRFVRLAGLQVILPPADLERLRALPADAGNVLVGPHPGPRDPYLMLDLYRLARRIPAGFLMDAETYHKRSVPARALIRRLGAIPVARGRRNPEAIAYLSRQLAAGRWCGIFPEGEVYYSREVMPMEYGALRIAVEAATAAERAAANGATTPILLTPFAHAYFYRDPKPTLRRTAAALSALEERPEVFGTARAGEIVARLGAVADRIIELRAAQYGVPRDAWDAPDRFQQAKNLAARVLEDLETRYLGAERGGYHRRRALRVRMKLYELLATSALTQAERSRLQAEIQKTRDVVMTVPFSHEYVAKYGDLEMATEYLRRYCWVLGAPEPHLGAQCAEVRVLESIDVQPIARRCRALPTAATRNDFLYEQTERLRASIQEGVDRICRERSTMKLSGW